MNFSYTEEQQSIFDLASQILIKGTPPARLLELERAEGPRFDPELWAKLGQSGLIGVAVPTEYDGGGLTFLEVAGVISGVGATAQGDMIEDNVVESKEIYELIGERND